MTVPEATGVLALLRHLDGKDVTTLSQMCDLNLSRRFKVSRTVARFHLRSATQLAAGRRTPEQKRATEELIARAFQRPSPG